MPQQKKESSKKGASTSNSAAVPTPSQTSNTSSASASAPASTLKTVNEAKDAAVTSSQVSPVTKSQVPLQLKEYLYKILVVGDLGTGKTSIIKRYVHNIFSMHYKSTIGVDFALKVIQWSPDTVIRLQLWDIAGQERFGNMTRVYYKEAVGALVVFDVTRISTFDGVTKWKADIDEKIRLPDGSKIPVVLLANKADLAKDAMIRNTYGQMEKFCQEKEFSGWFETSAKDNLNIDDACRFLVGKVLENDLAMMQKQAASSSTNRSARQGLVRPGVDDRPSGGAANGGGSCCA